MYKFLQQVINTTNIAHTHREIRQTFNLKKNVNVCYWLRLVDSVKRNGLCHFPYFKINLRNLKNGI
jgi:hypothetical protein